MIIGKSLIVKSGISGVRRSCYEMFAHLGLKGKINSPGTIFIKPNIVSMQHYSMGSITDPVILGHLVDYIRSFSGERILILESETIWKTRKKIEKGEPDYDQKEQLLGFNISLKNSGIEGVIKRKKNVGMLNITRADKLPARIVKSKLKKRFGKCSNALFPEFLEMVPLEFENGGTYISLSKIKSHKFRDTKVTNCMKNQYGLISYPDKTAYHNRLSDAILYTNMIAQSFFDCSYITEAMRYAMEGAGPILGTPIKNLGIAVCGGDPVEIDAIAATLMEVSPQKLDYIQLARGILGNYDENELQKIPKSLKHRFKLDPAIEKITRG